ncbi:MAG: Crp/Fnr family transcriptional regulator [Bacteroidia bacterium]|nr:Crp/Fnr family transcriptional regulator [Bacteroidia bacterium]
MEIAKIWYLEQFGFLSRIDKKDIEYLAKELPLHRVYKGNPILFSQPEEGQIYFLKKGSVKIGSLRADGREDLKYLAKQGDIFGEMALLNRQTSNDFAIALEDSLVCPMSVSTMNRLMDRNPGLHTAVHQLMGDRIEKLERRLDSILFKSSRVRILEFVLDFFKQFGKEEGEEIRVKNQLTHSDIAKLTATSRQSVNSIFNYLRKNKIIDYNTEWIWAEREKLDYILQEIQGEIPGDLSSD